MKINELVELNSGNYFNGAVQAEWYYQPEREEAVTCSFVFHGPDYYGVAASDVDAGSHRLIDTATYTKLLAQRLTSKSGNPFLMTIAGYGAGKSHLAVTLGSLFSGHAPELRGKILEHIQTVAPALRKDIESLIRDRHYLVLVMNGMNNFNMDTEMLRLARAALAQHHLDDGILKKITKAYETAKHFIRQTFDMKRESYLSAMRHHGLSCEDCDAEKYLLENMEIEQKVFDAVNEVFREVNGSDIRWDYGLSAGAILQFLYRQLCGETKTFDGILILFDELGRYIEYAAANPSIAGESALQQIFEAVQTAEGGIVFAGFIQSELSAYLSRIDKTSNIIRYVSRYEGSEKWYLSSNLETVLANQLQKKEPKSFNSKISSFVEAREHYFSTLFNRIQRWGKSERLKAVWQKENLFKNVIGVGCYPMHPLTVFMLSALSSWMQQRSVLSFTEEMFQKIGNEEVEGNWRPYIYPISIIDSGIFNELLDAEEKGKVQSRHALLYQEILSKTGDRMKREEIQVLKAVLLINVAKLEFYDRSDMISAISLCVGNPDEETVKSLFSALENTYGVISYDESKNKVDFLAETNGMIDFKKLFSQKLSRIGKQSCIERCDETIISLLKLDGPVETSFAKQSSISSMEWKWEKRLVQADKIDETYVNMLVSDLNSRHDGEKLRGILVYIYFKENEMRAIDEIAGLIKKYSLNQYAVDFFALFDRDDKFENSIRSYTLLKSFKEEERERFTRFYANAVRKNEKAISRSFSEMTAERVMIGSEGAVKCEEALEVHCTQRFQDIYFAPIPFVFDGFEKKPGAQIKNHYYAICTRLLDGSLTKTSGFQALPIDTKNRVKSVLMTGSDFSWNVMDSNCHLVEARNKAIESIDKQCEDKISEDGSITVFKVFSFLQSAPYGMNDYSLGLFLCWFIAYHRERLLIYSNDDIIRPAEIASRYFTKNKIKFSEVNALKLRLREGMFDDAVSELCREISGSTSVENCEELGKKLEKKILNCELTERLENLVAVAKRRVMTGKMLKQRIYGPLIQYRKQIQSADDSSACLAAADALLTLKIQVGEIEQGTQFCYSDTFNEDVGCVRAEANSVLNRFFENGMEEISCRSTEWVSFEQQYSELARRIDTCGLGREAAVLRKRIQQVGQQLEDELKYAGQIAEFDKTMAFCREVDDYSYADCVKKIDELERWNTFWEPTSYQRPMDEIANAIVKLNERQDDLRGIFKELLESALYVKSEADLKVFKKRVETALELEPPDEYGAEFRALSRQIGDILNFVSALNLETQEQADSLLENSRHTFAENRFFKIAEEAIELQTDRLLTLENEWKKQYLSIDWNSFSAQQCINWQNETAVMPGFLSVETIAEYETIAVHVSEQLAECKIQGVVALFSNLSIEERRDCLELLSELV